MSTMNMPGFTAETSLYRTNTNYGMAGAYAVLPGAGGVVPQARACGPCNDLFLGKRICCDERLVCDSFPFGCHFVLSCVTELCGIPAPGIGGTIFA